MTRLVLAFLAFAALAAPVRAADRPYPVADFDRLVVEGSGTLRATRIAADALSLGLLGAGALELSGTAKTLRGQFQGTGSVAAASLAANAATLTANTSGSVALQVNGRAEIIAYGLGTVTITGRPACTVSGPGTGQVSCGASNQGQRR
jgi:hypothetical protein